EAVAAILTSVLVSLEHIVPRKFYFLLRKPIKDQQHDHAGNSDLERNCRDHFMLRRTRGEVAPAVEIVRRKIVRIIRRHDLGVPGVYERKRATSRADVHRLPEPVEHQNLTIQQRVQVWKGNRIMPRLLRTSA